MPGWVKVYRDILNNPILCKDAEYFSVYMYLVLNANHTQKETLFAKEKTVLKPGQLLTGRKQIADHFGINETKVQRILKKLEEEGLINQQTSNKNRLITITSWEVHQRAEQKEQQQQESKEEALPLQEIMDKWNSIGVGQIKVLTGPRLKQLKACLAATSLEDFYTAISNIKQSHFLLGDNERKWQITFDWFIEEAHYTKVLEGNYLKPIKPQINLSSLPAKVQLQNKMAEHGNLLDNIEDLEEKYITQYLQSIGK